MKEFAGPLRFITAGVVLAVLGLLGVMAAGSGLGLAPFLAPLLVLLALLFRAQENLRGFHLQRQFWHS